MNNDAPTSTNSLTRKNMSTTYKLRAINNRGSHARFNAAK